MYVNAVDLDIVPAERENFLAAIKENGAAAAKEPGCKRFDILNLASDPNHFFLYEVYDNEAAFKAHRETDHFKKYMQRPQPKWSQNVTPGRCRSLHQTRNNRFRMPGLRGDTETAGRAFLIRAERFCVAGG